MYVDLEPGHAEFLLATHVFFLFVVYIYLRLAQYAEAVWTTYSMIISFFYHWTRAYNVTIFLTPETWQRMDWVSSFLTILVTILYISNFKNRYTRYLLFACIQPLILFLFFSFGWAHWVTITMIVIYILIPVIHYSIIQQIPPFNWKKFGFGIFLFVLGVVFISIPELSKNGLDNYWIWHGLWHIAVIMGAYFIILSNENIYYQIYIKGKTKKK